MHTPGNTLKASDLKMMLQLTAYVTAYIAPEAITLLHRLEKEYALAKKNDPEDYAKQLLTNLLQSN